MAIYDPEGDWIFHEQGVKLILERYNVGEPYADIIVKRYRESDEVRYCDDCTICNNLLRLGLKSFPGGLTGFPFSKTYFLDYLERNPPQKIKSEPNPVTDEPKQDGAGPRARALEALQALAVQHKWPRGKVPKQSVLPNKDLEKLAVDWLKSDCARQGVRFDEKYVKRDTILRAAARKK